MAEEKYPLADSSTATRKNGWVLIDWEKDVQAMKANYDNTLVVLRNGRAFLLAGRTYGV